MNFLGNSQETQSIQTIFEAAIAGAVILAAILLLSETPAYPLAYGILLTVVLYIVLEAASGKSGASGYTNILDWIKSQLG